MTQTSGFVPPRQLVILGGVTALGPLSIDFYLPGFPELARALNSSEAAVQLTLSACVVGLAIGQPLAGPASDAVGRRLPIVLGLLCWSIASLACALAPSIATLIALRFAQGLAGSVGIVVARAALRDHSSGDSLTRSLARLMLVTGTVPVLAPTVGGLFLQVTDWRGLFLVLGLVGVVVTGMVLVVFRETLPPERRTVGAFRQAVDSHRLLLRDTRFLRAALVTALAFAALFAYVSSASFVLRQGYGLSATEFGIQFGLNSAALVGGAQLGARIAQRAPAVAVLTAALAVAATAGLTLLLAASTGALGLAGVMLPLMVAVGGIGAAMPLATTVALDPHPERAGAASGLLGALQFTVGSAVAPITGMVGASSAVPLGVVLIVCLGVAAVLALGASPAGGRGGSREP